jgi:hypothetical protein
MRIKESILPCATFASTPGFTFFRECLTSARYVRGALVPAFGGPDKYPDCVLFSCGNSRPGGECNERAPTRLTRFGAIGKGYKCAREGEWWSVGQDSVDNLGWLIRMDTKARCRITGRKLEDISQVHFWILLKGKRRKHHTNLNLLTGTFWCSTR